MAKTKSNIGGQKAKLMRVTKIHFVYAGIYALAIIIFDSWNLIVPTVIRQRWMVAALLLVVTTVVWYSLRAYGLSRFGARLGLMALVLTDIAVAAFTVYSERGMASPAVMLMAIPIAASVAMQSRSFIYATASLASAGYVSAVIAYFVDHPSEGYKVQLYGTIALYVSVFFVLAALLSSLVGDRNS